MRRPLPINAASPTAGRPDLHTLLVGLLALQAGILLCRRIAVLDRLDIPPPVVGGVLMSLVTAAAYVVAGVDITFATTLRDVLLLVFFVTIGLSAKLSALRAGGRPLAMLCAVTVLLLVLQNVTGLLMARLWGAHPFMGLIAGSISFVGGPGTAMAWATQARPWGCSTRPSWLWPRPRWRWSSAQWSRADHQLAHPPPRAAGAGRRRRGALGVPRPAAGAAPPPSRSRT